MKIIRHDQMVYNLNDLTSEEIELVERGKEKNWNKQNRLYDISSK